MKSKKGYKYYGFVFLFSTFALGVYVLYLTIREGNFDLDMALSLITVPFMFTLFLFIFDKVFDKFFPSKVKVEDTEYNIYLNKVSKVIDDNCEFSIEDYRRLRGNAGFQKSMEQVYKILQNGESEEINFDYLDKKFKKNTNEYKALSVVITEVKKMIENSWKDY